jgi:serine/threonine protein kinase
MQFPDTIGEIATGTIVNAGDDSYEILEEVGRGGMGVVYKARQISLQRTVALKMLPPEMSARENLMQRLLREARLSAAITHPNIVKVFSMQTTEQKVPFLVMEFVEGRTLESVLKSDGVLNEAQFKRYFDQALSALEELHAHGIIHRDITPANIMVTAGDTIKIMDFGIAKDVLGISGINMAVTQAGSVVGSPWYMSPEQCRSEELDARSDLYSIGCVMFKSITGAHIFEGDNALEVMFKHSNEQISTTGEVRIPHHSSVILKAIQRDKQDRFESASQMRAALNTEGAELRIPARKQKRQTSRFVVGIAAGLVTAVGAAGLATFRFEHDLDLQPRDNISALRDRIERAESLMRSRATLNDPPRQFMMLLEAQKLYLPVADNREQIELLPPQYQKKALLGAASVTAANEYERSLDYYERAMAMMSSPQERLMIEGRAVDLMLKLGRHEEALQRIEKTLEMFRTDQNRLGGPSVRQGFLFRKATVLAELDQVEAALKVWKDYQPSDAINDQAVATRGRHDMVMQLAKKGLHATAIPLLKENISLAERLLQKIQVDSDPEFKTLLETIRAEETNALIASYLCAGRLAEAERLIPYIVKYQQTRNAPGFKSLATTYVIYSQTLSHTNSARALQALDEARKYAERANALQPHAADEEMFSILNQRYWFHRGSGQHELALRVAEQMSQLPTDGVAVRPPFWSMVSHTNQGMALLSLNRLQEAERELLLAENMMNQTKFAGVTNKMLLLLYLAEDYDRQGKHDDARRYYELLVEEAEKPETLKERPDMRTAALQRYEQFKTGAVKYD